MKRLFLAAACVAAFSACSNFNREQAVPVIDMDKLDRETMSAIEPHQIHKISVTGTSAEAVYFSIKNALEDADFTDFNVYDDHTAIMGIGNEKSKFKEAKFSAKIVENGGNVGISLSIISPGMAKYNDDDIISYIRSRINDDVEMRTTLKLPK